MQEQLHQQQQQNPQQQEEDDDLEIEIDEAGQRAQRVAAQQQAPTPAGDDDVSCRFEVPCMPCKDVLAAWRPCILSETPPCNSLKAVSWRLNWVGELPDSPSRGEPDLGNSICSCI